MKTEGCQRNDEGEMIVVAVEGGCSLATTGLCQLQSKSPAFSSSAETSAYRVQLTIQPLYGGQIANSTWANMISGSTSNISTARLIESWLSLQIDELGSRTDAASSTSTMTSSTVRHGGLLGHHHYIQNKLIGFLAQASRVRSFQSYVLRFSLPVSSVTSASPVWRKVLVTVTCRYTTTN